MFARAYFNGWSMMKQKKFNGLATCRVLMSLTLELVLLLLLRPVS